MVHCEIEPLENHTCAGKAFTFIVWLRTEVSLHNVVRNWWGWWGGGGGSTKDIVLGEGSYKEQSRLKLLPSISFSCNLAYIITQAFFKRSWNGWSKLKHYLWNEMNEYWPTFLLLGPGEGLSTLRRLEGLSMVGSSASSTMFICRKFKQFDHHFKINSYTNFFIPSILMISYSTRNTLLLFGLTLTLNGFPKVWSLAGEVSSSRRGAGCFFR